MDPPSRPDDTAEVELSAVRYEFGGFTLDTDARQLLVGGRAVHLSGKASTFCAFSWSSGHGRSTSASFTIACGPTRS